MTELNYIDREHAVGIVIPTNGRDDFLADLIRSIDENTEAQHDIVIVDSSNGKAVRKLLKSEPFCRRDSAVAHILCRQERFSFAKAINAGVRYLGPREHYLFLNDDTEVVTDGWLTLMLAADYLAEGKAGVVCCSTDNAPRAWQRWKEPPEGHPPKEIADDPAFWCVLVSGKAWRHVGQLDERTFDGSFYGGEDKEWVARARTMGWKVLHCPFVFVRHRRCASFGYDFCSEKQEAHDAAFGASVRNCSNPRVAILLPHKGRPKMLRKCLADLAEKTKYSNFFVQIVFDDDEKGYRSFDAGEWPFEVRAYLTDANIEYVEAMNLAYQLAKDDARLFSFWADDFTSSPGWLCRAVERYSEKFPQGGGLLALHEAQWGEKLAIFGLFDEAFIDALPYPRDCLYWPEYQHYGSDSDMTQVAMKIGRWAYAPDIEMFHPPSNERRKYPWIGKRHADASLFIERKEGDFRRIGDGRLVLYCGIFDNWWNSDHVFADGLEDHGFGIRRYNYRAEGDLEGKILGLLDQADYQMLWMNKAEGLMGERLKEIRKIYPSLRIVQTIGDQRPEPFRNILDIGSYLDGFFMVGGGRPLADYFKLGGMKLAVGMFQPCHYAGYHRLFLERDIDVGFGGSRYPGELPRRRNDLVDAVKERLKHSPWRFCEAGFDSPRLLGEDYVRFINRCKIGLCISAYNDIPLYASDRACNFMSSGTFVLHEHFPGIEKLFRRGHHLDWFEDFDELVEKIKYYSANPEERAKIAAFGQQLVGREFGPYRTARRMLRVLDGEEVEPWVEVLRK